MAMSSESEDMLRLSEQLQDPAASEGRLRKKLKESPFMVAGIAVGTGIAGYGFYNIRNSKIRTSYYLMQLRVAAQGSLVALLLGGTVVDLYGRLKKKFYDPPSSEDK